MFLLPYLRDKIRPLVRAALSRLPFLPRRSGVVGSLVPPPSTVEYRNAAARGEFYRRWHEGNYEVTSSQETRDEDC